MPPDVVPAPRGRDLLRDRTVTRYLVGATVQTTATALQEAVLLKQIYDITDSELALGIVGLLTFLPALVLLPLTGSTADRFDRRRVASIAVAVEAVTSVLYLLYAATDPTSAIPIFATAMVFGTASAFAAPAFRALPPLIAPDNGLPRLIAVYSATWQLASIVGPAASGFLMARSTMLPYGVATAGFVGSSLLVLTLTLRRPQVRTPPEERASLHHALEGLRFIRRREVLLGAIALDMFAVLFGGAVALLPAIAEDRLHVGDIGYGWLRAAPGIGAVAVTAFLATRPVRRRVGRTLLAAVAVFGVATMVLGFTRNYVVAFLALLVLAGADSVSVFIRATIVPLATPDRMRGRVMAVENVFIGASNELGAFESGVVGAALGVGPAVWLGGLLTLGVVGVWTVRFPSLRGIDRFSDIDVDRIAQTTGESVLDSDGPPADGSGAITSDSPGGTHAKDAG